MPRDPEFPTLEEVLAIHADQLAAWGGSAGVRDRGAFASAVAMPQATAFGQFVHPDIFSMAAAYAFPISESQAFLDGNKRTALASALTFLALDGYDTSDRDDALFEAMIAVGTRELTKCGLASVLRELTRA